MAGFERLAYAAASARLRRPSLDRTLPTWCSTVLRLMKRRSEISGLERPWPEQVEHLGLALGQQLAALPGRGDLDAERAQHRCGGVDVASRLEPFERLERGSGLGQRHLRLVGDQHAGELEP